MRDYSGCGVTAVGQQSNFGHFVTFSLPMSPADGRFAAILLRMNMDSDAQLRDEQKVIQVRWDVLTAVWEGLS